ncbi:MAG: ImpA family metalloprotease [Granulosicoccus sp.]|nr:ImpA family metalloprotease [Granulosicoccus sp.]
MQLVQQSKTNRSSLHSRYCATISLCLSLIACGGGSPPSQSAAVTETNTAASLASAEGALTETVTADLEPTDHNEKDQTQSSGVVPETESANSPNPDQNSSPATDNGSSGSNSVGLEKNLQHALSTGTTAGINETILLDAAIETAGDLTQRCNSILEEVFPDGLALATMPYLSNYVYSSRQSNIPLHVASDSGAVYAWLGERDSGSRYAYYGAGIFTRSDSHYWGNLGNELAENTQAVLSWITRSDNTVPLTPYRVLALDERARTQFENWLIEQDQEQHWIISTDPGLLASGDYDMLAGLAGGDLPELETAIDDGKSILIWSEVFNPGVGIQQLGLNWNWWGTQITGDGESITNQCQLAYFGGDVLATLHSLKQNDLEFDYSGDACTTSLYTTTCSPTAVTRNDGLSLQQTFLSGVEELQQQIANSDAKGHSVFDQSSEETLLKMSVLLGDMYRANVTYPMDHLTTPGTQFYQALFADYTNHYSRENNAAQTDAGDYGVNLGSLSQRQAEIGNVILRPTQFAEWNSTGYTARPGKPITLTRTDNNPATVSVRLNMLRSQSTWIWNTNGYTRPLFTSSHPIAMPVNSSVTMSSPIGGPVYVHWDANTNDDSSPDITLEIEGAVAHPFLNDFTDNSISTFTSALNTDVFDWVDIKTPAVEVHSRFDLLVQALNREDGDSENGHTQNDVQRWVGNLNTYLIGSALSLAGFNDDSIAPMNHNVAAFCSERQLDCADTQLHRKPPLQHINADLRASCGDLCSGNPFDSNSPINPLGYGESHEMGHNLQRHRLNFYGARSIEASNNIFPLYSAWRWLQDNSLSRHPTIRLPSPAKTYEQLQQSVSFQSEPGIGHPIWIESQIYVNADVRFMLYLQLMFIHHEWENDTETGATGWDIFTKLYKLERQFDYALSSDQEWSAQRERLGFTHFDRSAAQALDSNNFMAIALSLISKRDHTNYLRAWGIDVSDATQSQIQANGTTGSIPLVFWRTPDDRYIRTEFPSDEPANLLPLDGVTPWPAE